MIKANVARVVDGDTVEVTAKFKVRLDFVDAPETKGSEREEGLKTKQYVIDRLTGKDIDLDVKCFDMYGRALAVIYLDGENINGELIKKGLVEIYTPANHNNGVFDK
jgi:micrococcal nuclease